MVDLRSTTETHCVPHPLDDLAGYRVLPLIDPAAEAVRESAAEPTVGDVHAAGLTRNAIPIAASLRALAAAPTGAVMVCCTAGRDRTGMITALVLALVGVDRAAIAADYADLPGHADHATGGATQQAARCSQGRANLETPPADVASSAPSRRRGAGDILHMLDHLDRAHGSTTGYLHWLGLRPDQITALRARPLPDQHDGTH